MIKRQLILFALTLLLLTTVIETRIKKLKCPPILPPDTTPKCSDGFVGIGKTEKDSDKYIDCDNCFEGSDINDPNNKNLLEYRLNTLKIFGTGGWIFGASVPKIGTTTGTNILKLVYIPFVGWEFKNPGATKKYQVVISFQTEECYTTYEFDCLEFKETEILFFNTLGIGNGTLNQNVKHVTYFYKECGSSGPVDCHNGKMTLDKNDIVDKNSYIDCENCITGLAIGNTNESNTLEHKLNTDLIFTTGGWTFGAKLKVATGDVEGPNILKLAKKPDGTFDFIFTTSKKYEVVIAIQGLNCYTTYEFSCFDSNGKKELDFNTLGHDLGIENQTITDIIYFYRECGSIIVPCGNGEQKIGTNVAIECKDCSEGQALDDPKLENTLGYKLNEEKIFGKDTWTLGASVGSVTVGPNLLGLKLDKGSYTFITNTNIKYEVVIAVQVEECYTIYRFACIGFEKNQALDLNTLGVFDGTLGQTITNIVYFYRECDYTIVDCKKGEVIVGTQPSTDCDNCIIIGTGDIEKILGDKLNIEKIFGVDGWQFGSIASPSVPSSLTDPLGLIYDSKKGYEFTKTTSTKYEVVIAIQAGKCLVPYLIPCMAYDAVKIIDANTFGVDKGTGQPIEQVVYFYRSCGNYPCNPSFTPGPEEGELNCIDFGTVYSTIREKSDGCWGAFAGNSGDEKCIAKDNYCLKNILETPTAGCPKMCFKEKLVPVEGNNQVVGTYWSINITPGKDIREGTYTLNSGVKMPYIITLKAANGWSAYFVQDGLEGNWASFNHGLSHASLWTPCDTEPTFLQLHSK